MQRDRLVDLVTATARPEVSAHTIPRAMLEDRGQLGPLEPDEDDDFESVSPLAVLVVLAMLLTVFVAVASL